jgi:hypothetical protein
MGDGESEGEVAFKDLLNLVEVLMTEPDRERARVATARGGGSTRIVLIVVSFCPRGAGVLLNPDDNEGALFCFIEASTTLS